MGKEIEWSATPPRSDLDAAYNYLSLIMPEAQARRLVAGLRHARSGTREAKDLLRAAGLPLLEPDDPNVKEQLKKIKKGEPLTPVLLIRGNRAANVPLLVADGYHRLCGACHHDDSCPVACRVVG